MPHMQPPVIGTVLSLMTTLPSCALAENEHSSLEPFPTTWSHSDVAISVRGQERSAERSIATVKGRDAAPVRKRRVPSGCPPAASRCVIPLARCASIALRGMPDGMAAGGQQSGSIWSERALVSRKERRNLRLQGSATRRGARPDAEVSRPRIFDWTRRDPSDDAGGSQNRTRQLL